MNLRISSTATRLTWILKNAGAIFSAWELHVCAKFQINSSKTVVATFRTYLVHTYGYIHRTYRQKGEIGETWDKPNYVANLRTGPYTVQVCEIVQFSD